MIIIVTKGSVRGFFSMKLLSDFDFVEVVCAFINISLFSSNLLMNIIKLKFRFE
jgi:hypothetical protein